MMKLRIVALFIATILFSAEPVLAAAEIQLADECAATMAANEISEKLKAQLQGLTYDFAFVDTPKRLDKLLYVYDLRSLPKIKKKHPKPESVEINRLHFMQKSAKYRSSSQKGGYKVLETAQQLRSGEINIHDLPAIMVWQDKKGRIWSLNHRRLAAVVLSGAFTEIPVTWATPEEAKEIGWDKNDPLEGGKSIDIVNHKDGVDGGPWAVRISIPKKSEDKGNVE